MKVRDLLIELQTLPPEADVLVITDEGDKAVSSVEFAGGEPQEEVFLLIDPSVN